MMANTMGIVRVACSNGPVDELPGARITSGARATNSVANFCILADGSCRQCWRRERAFSPNVMVSTA
jgi:hypothetical protein